ncbi:MAG: hypothetical protein WDM78_09020 [Puia sp.]
MQTFKNNQKIHYTLRVAAAMCFIGHGAFGIITKAIWCNYFALFGIDKVHAYQLMPVLGTVDILLGFMLLFKPVRAVAAWLVIWGMITAACRPLSGEPFAEFIERAGNYGAPLALLVLAGGIKLNFKWLFSTMNPQEPVSEKSLAQVKVILRFTVFSIVSGSRLAEPYSKTGFDQSIYFSWIFQSCERVVVSRDL